jgi:hypothetical protein
MRLATTTFVLAVVLTASAAIGLAYLDGRLGHRDGGVRAIHYDTQYNLSSQRRGGPDE